MGRMMDPGIVYMHLTREPLYPTAVIHLNSVSHLVSLSRFSRPDWRAAFGPDLELRGTVGPSFETPAGAEPTTRLSPIMLPESRVPRLSAGLGVSAADAVVHRTNCALQPWPRCNSEVAILSWNQVRSWESSGQ
ncbi:hypothetical protein CpipJ_CPIJ011119 [Culex quinquefasciatus]|uniref:Uncharacterized protein n=1 Tax=Culex quinquefasciatus TaxID=7176 RepID=B0WVQ5_CULQU|nr:hypothetical protein CpipJ_CPIJ011119 [Culex quinquefasciatus]|eukprot:XP_001861477.1 hypothetical protein CpipJ_CPIJ011119 [Culex quinquefasciatus]